MATTQTERLLDTTEAADYLGRKPGTLYNWRSRREGPRYSGKGRGVRYRKRDLDAWIDERTH